MANVEAVHRLLEQVKATTRRTSILLAIPESSTNFQWQLWSSCESAGVGCEPLDASRHHNTLYLDGAVSSCMRPT